MKNTKILTVFCEKRPFSQKCIFLKNISKLLCNNGEKCETKRKIKILSSNFCSPLISAHCVQISAQKLHFLRRNKKKTVFEKNAFLWKIAIFREKWSKFRPIRQKHRFVVFFHHSLNGPQYFSDFQHHCHDFG